MEEEDEKDEDNDKEDNERMRRMRSRCRSRIWNLYLFRAGAGNLKNGQLRQPCLKH